jgi:hypothetical protein
MYPHPAQQLKKECLRAPKGKEAIGSLGPTKKCGLGMVMHYYNLSHSGGSRKFKASLSKKLVRSHLKKTIWVWWYVPVVQLHERLR